MSFHVQELMPGIFHIQDAMGVYMTLLTGSESALLFDTGFGLWDLNAYVRTLTDLPLTVFLSHAHFDHVLGARFFSSASFLKEEQVIAREYTNEKWRRSVLKDAHDAGIDIDESAFLSSPMPPFTVISEGDIDLGGLTARVISCPGHTPGSAVIYVLERELLLTGDDWNPVTWLFFPEALPIREYRRNVQELLTLPFRHVICSHRGDLYDRCVFEDFLSGLTEEAIASATDTPEGLDMGISTAAAALPHDQLLIFDRDKTYR